MSGLLGPSAMRATLRPMEAAVEWLVFTVWLILALTGGLLLASGRAAAWFTRRPRLQTLTQSWADTERGARVIGGLWLVLGGTLVVLTVVGIIDGPVGGRGTR